MYVGRWDVPFDDVPVHERGVTGVQRLRHAANALRAAHVRRVPDDNAEPVLAEMLDPAPAASAVGILENRDRHRCRGLGAAGEPRSRRGGSDKSGEEGGTRDARERTILHRWNLHFAP